MKYLEKGNKKALIALTCMLMLSAAGCGRSVVITEQTDVQQVINMEWRWLRGLFLQELQLLL